MLPRIFVFKIMAVNNVKKEDENGYNGEYISEESDKDLVNHTILKLLMMQRIFILQDIDFYGKIQIVQFLTLFILAMILFSSLK